MSIETNLHTGDRVRIVAIGLGVEASGRYIGYSGGPTAMVELDGTQQIVSAPLGWIRKEVAK